MREIILGVPLMNQPKGSFHCNVASMRMLLAYYGDKYSHEELLQHFPEIDQTQVGVSPTTALLMVKEGFEVSYSMFQGDLLKNYPHLKGKTDKDLELFKEHLNYLVSEPNSQRQWEKIIKFIEAGGKFLIKQLNTKDLDSFIESKLPVRVGVKNSIFYSNPQNDGKHAVVISGMKDDQYLINDPAPRFTEPYWINKNILKEAWHANGSVATVITNRK